jgi:cytochrome c-type biogenesis protein CcmH/NrfG
MTAVAGAALCLFAAAAATGGAPAGAGDEGARARDGRRGAGPSREDAAAAVAAHRRAVRQNPGDAASRVRLGAALERAGQLGAALRELRQATRLAPDDAAGWQALGRLHLRRREASPAAAALEKAAALVPRDAAVAADLCRALVELDPRSDRAVEQCRHVLALEPAHAQARLLLIRTLVAQGQCRKAGDDVLTYIGLPGVTPAERAEAAAMHKRCSPAAKR